MMQNTLILAVDLGTSTTTASHARVRNYLNDQRKLCREKLGVVSDVKDWPGCIVGATGNHCVPTDLIYHKDTRELLFWGFGAQEYLDDSFHDIPHSDVFMVETIKLLLPDPDEAKAPSPALERYRAMRTTLSNTLAKDPYEIFQDLLVQILAHVLNHAIRKYSIGLHNHQFELVLAFPSGWEDQIHTAVATIGAKALQMAISTQGLMNVSFGIENVYTVSETLCGVKEWLRETVAEISSVDLEVQSTNLDELNEGDCFLPIDIGGGTGCITPLKLISKHPLAVEQLDKTQSLEVSGEAVQAEFERMLRPRITKTDYPGDVERAIFQICRRFKEEKKKCGTLVGSSSRTWNCPVTGLKASPRKGFEKDCIRFDRKQLEGCFDPVIDILDEAINETRRKFPSIKAIVFLGQFGGNSPYLKKRMASNPVSAVVKIRHSQSGKLDVVQGAISERLTLDETFVRRFKTLKSYGTLVTLVYNEEIARVFPNPQHHGAVPFERAHDGLRLKVIEWAIPKNTIIKDGRACDIGMDGRRHHTWPFAEDELGFEDIIIISDEDVPKPQYEGKSYTVWTESHQKNQVYVGGQRKLIQKIPFCWDLIMSQKLDAQGNIVGPYERGDLNTVWFPERQIKKHRRLKLRDLHYDLIWEITEMQVKVYVQAVFPKQVGSSLAQLGKEQALGPGEKTATGESRSKALNTDIEITHSTSMQNDDEGVSEDDEHVPTAIHANFQPQQVFGHSRQPQQLEAESLSSQTTKFYLASKAKQKRATTHQTTSNEVHKQMHSFHSAPNGTLEQSITTQDLHQDIAPLSAGTSTSGSVRPDGRRRDGCYTCKDRKKKCEGAYTVDRANGNRTCKTCFRVGIPCDMNEPLWARDPAQRELQRRERRKLVKQSKKRKYRDHSESSGAASRDRSVTIAPVDGQHRGSSFHGSQSTEMFMEDVRS